MKKKPFLKSVTEVFKEVGIESLDIFKRLKIIFKKL